MLFEIKSLTAEINREREVGFIPVWIQHIRSTHGEFEFVKVKVSLVFQRDVHHAELAIIIRITAFVEVRSQSQ